MRKLLPNQDGDMNMILVAMVMAITFAVGILIVFNVIAGLDFTTIDNEFGGANVTPSRNASTDLRENVETFYTVGPIALIVVAAVGILSYVMLLRKQ